MSSRCTAFWIKNTSGCEKKNNMSKQRIYNHIAKVDMYLKKFKLMNSY